MENDQYQGFVEVVRRPTPTKIPVARFHVYLYRSDDCIRGWLAYRKNESGHSCTVEVVVESTSGEKAKNAAITAANQGFEGCTVVKVHRGANSIWNADLFPELDNLEADTDQTI